MLSNESMPMLIFKWVVYAVFQGLLILYLFGFTSKDGFFGFLHQSASVGDVIIIVGAGVFMLDDLTRDRSEILDDRTQQRFDKLDASIMKISNSLTYGKKSIHND